MLNPKITRKLLKLTNTVIHHSIHSIFTYFRYTLVSPVAYELIFKKIFFFKHTCVPLKIRCFGENDNKLRIRFFPTQYYDVSKCPMITWLFFNYARIRFDFT